MRLAGTCSMYSKKAMPQLASAATNQGFESSSLRCAYQANVMNTLLAASSNTVSPISRIVGCPGSDPGVTARVAREPEQEHREQHDHDRERQRLAGTEDPDRVHPEQDVRELHHHREQRQQEQGGHPAPAQQQPDRPGERA